MKHTYKTSANPAFFWDVQNLTANTRSSAPMGVRPKEACEIECPMLPLEPFPVVVDKPGDVIRRRIKRSADVTDISPRIPVRGALPQSFICLDLPISDDYYVVP